MRSNAYKLKSRNIHNCTGFGYLLVSNIARGRSKDWGLLKHCLGLSLASLNHTEGLRCGKDGYVHIFLSLIQTLQVSIQRYCRSAMGLPKSNSRIFISAVELQLEQLDNQTATARWPSINSSKINSTARTAPIFTPRTLKAIKTIDHFRAPGRRIIKWPKNTRHHT